MKESSLKAKLRRLGSTPKAIAKNLKARGIKGTKCDSAHCPLAQFLVSTTKGATSVVVTGDDAWVYTQGQGFTVIVDLPKACKDFVKSFDSGKFANLVEKPLQV